MKKNLSLLYSGLIWILSGTALIVYATLGLNEVAIPGVEELVAFAEATAGWKIFLAVFMAMFIEGLYVIGSVFPGTSIVLLSAIVTQATGLTAFLGIIVSLFAGWTLAGIANVTIAKSFKKMFAKNANVTSTVTHQEITWFPAFRANTEVAEIVEGKSVKTVLYSSTKIKLYTSGFFLLYTLLIPLLIDITALSNTEGFWGLFIIATISVGIGTQKILEYRSNVSSTTETD
jgi:hypothetical protein